MYRKSWRVQVAYTDKTKVLDPDSWPEGWGVRQYFRARNKPGYTALQPQTGAPQQQQQKDNIVITPASESSTTPLLSQDNRDSR